MDLGDVVRGHIRCSAPCMRFASTVLAALFVGCSSSSAPSAPPRDEGTPPPSAGEEGGPPSAGEDSTPLPAALPDGITALSVPLASAPDAELAPFDAIAARVDAIGIGEAIHTSGGFVDAKVVLVKRLVEKLGYRAIAFEASRAWVADGMAPYVATGAGTPEDAMKSLYQVWWSPTTRDLMQWLFAYNREHAADPVRVTGFDMHQPEVDAPRVKAFVARVAGADSSALAAGVTTCSVVYDPKPPYPQSDYDACVDGLDTIGVWYLTHESQIEASIGHDAYADAQLDLLSWRAWQEQYELLQESSPLADRPRDVAMAAIFADQRARALAGRKVVVWAHDWHLEKAHGEAGPTGMGEIVASQMKERYAAVGIVGWDVRIDWPPHGPDEAHVPSASSYEGLLHGLGHPSLFVDLPRTTGTFSAGTMRTLGTPPNDEWQVPSRQYDALVYLDASAPMTHLGW